MLGLGLLRPVRTARRCAGRIALLAVLIVAGATLLGGKLMILSAGVCARVDSGLQASAGTASYTTRDGDFVRSFVNGVEGLGVVCADLRVLAPHRNDQRPGDLLWQPHGRAAPASSQPLLS